MKVSAVALLGAVVALVAVTVGAVLTLFLAGGDASTVLARAGIITSISGGVIASLLALLLANRAELMASAVEQQTNGKGGVTQTLNGHGDQLEAAEARIAYLEGRVGSSGQEGSQSAHSDQP